MSITKIVTNAVQYEKIFVQVVRATGYSVEYLKRMPVFDFFHLAKEIKNEVSK